MNKHTIILATRNAGKVAELAGPLGELGIEVLGMDAFPDVPEVDETGTTFEENALLKARTVAAATGLVAIADDSGLEVDALGGAPGIYSARYADDMPDLPADTRDGRNCLKLLAALSKVGMDQRGGRFRCVMAAVSPCGKSLTAPGAWEGRILFQPRGKNGFGYDPLFFDPELGCSAAELPREQKMLHSHRSRALRELLRQWPDFWSRRE